MAEYPSAKRIKLDHRFSIWHKMRRVTYRSLFQPEKVRSAAKSAYTNYIFQRTLRRIAKLPAEQLPTRKMLANLRTIWGNESWAANIDYLAEVARMAATTVGPILECGSGLTTLLIGSIASRRGIELWSLEHIPQWYAYVDMMLERFKISNVTLCHSELRDYGDFSWYNPPLASMPEEFRLVICDGPPHTTMGGRYGLLPVLRQRLPVGALILLDDADRASEAKALHRWKIESGVQVTIRKAPLGTSALVIC